MSKRYYFDLMVDNSYVVAESKAEAHTKIKAIIKQGVEHEIYEEEEHIDE